MLATSLILINKTLSTVTTSLHNLQHRTEALENKAAATPASPVLNISIPPRFLPGTSSTPALSVPGTESYSSHNLAPLLIVANNVPENNSYACSDTLVILKAKDP